MTERAAINEKTDITETCMTLVEPRLKQGAISVCELGKFEETPLSKFGRELKGTKKPRECNGEGSHHHEHLVFIHTTNITHTTLVKVLTLFRSTPQTIFQSSILGVAKSTKEDQEWTGW